MNSKGDSRANIHRSINSIRYRLSVNPPYPAIALTPDPDNGELMPGTVNSLRKSGPSIGREVAGGIVRDASAAEALAAHANAVIGGGNTHGSGHFHHSVSSSKHFAVSSVAAYGLYGILLPLCFILSGMGLIKIRKRCQ
jgi:hypothetical protein